MQWIPAFSIEYYLGVDGISTPLILLSTFLTPMIVVAAWEVIKQRPAQYMAAFLILEGLMVGVFSALDGMLFYVFWEAMLIPMFIIIGVWGGERRVYATVKFFLYTFLGSVLMLVALVYMYLQAGSFSILDFHACRSAADRTDLDFPGLPGGFCRQGADVAGAHLAAGCSRGGADGRFGHSGRGAAEDGRLRLSCVSACRLRRMRARRSTVLLLRCR